jgi:hypothetical protein
MSHSIDAPGSSSFGTTISGGTPNQLTQFNATGDNVVDSNLGSTGNQTTLTEGTEAAPSFVMSQNTNTGINMKENGANGWLQHINNGAVIVHMYHSFWDFKVPITTNGAVTCAGITSSGTVKTTNGILEIGATATSDRVTIGNTNVTKNTTLQLPNWDGTFSVWGDANSTEALTVDKATVSSGATTANTTYEVTTAGGASADFSNMTLTSVEGDTGTTSIAAGAVAQGTIFKSNTAETPTNYDGAVLTPVLPIFGNVIEITSDNATAANRRRNFPVNSGVNGQEITVYLSGGANKAEIGGITFDADAAPEDNMATFIRIGGNWLVKTPLHQASDGA